MYNTTRRAAISSTIFYATTCHTQKHPTLPAERRSSENSTVIFMQQQIMHRYDANYPESCDHLNTLLPSSMQHPAMQGYHQNNSSFLNCNNSAMT